MPPQSCGGQESCRGGPPMKRETLMRIVAALLVIVGVVAFESAVRAQDTARGTWTAEWRADKADSEDDAATGATGKTGEHRLQLNINRSQRGSMFGNSYRIDEFKGLTL